MRYKFYKVHIYNHKLNLSKWWQLLFFLKSANLIFIYLFYSIFLQGDPTSPFWRRSALGFLWREWCWSWNSSTLATSCEELTHWKRLWHWEGLRARGERDNRGWMASLTPWTWVWVNSGSWWGTGRPGVLRFMGSQESDTTERLNWTELIFCLVTPHGCVTSPDQRSNPCPLQRNCRLLTTRPPGKHLLFLSVTIQEVQFYLFKKYLLKTHGNRQCTMHQNEKLRNPAC